MTRRSLLAAGAAAQEGVLAPDIFDDRFQDPAVLLPKAFRVELDNPMARAMRVKLAGDQLVPVHDMRSGTLVAVTEVHLRFTRASTAKPYDVHLEAGATRWFYADTHSLRNLSPRAAEFLFVETKEKCGGRG